MDQLNYLYNQQRKIDGQKFKDHNHQLVYDFNRFDFTSNYATVSDIISNSIKRGAIIYLSIDDSKSDGNLFKIHLVVRNWNLQRSKIQKYHDTHDYRYYSLFMVRKNKVHTSEIENLKIDNCMISIRLFRIWNMLKFDDIRISKNWIYSYQPIFEFNSVRSYNVTIFDNEFSHNICIFYINPIKLVDKSMAFQQNY